MTYTFTNMSNSGRPSWAAQHPDTTVVGFGRSKLAAIRQLEASKGSRTRAFDILKDALNFPREHKYPVSP